LGVGQLAPDTPVSGGFTRPGRTGDAGTARRVEVGLCRADGTLVVAGTARRERDGLVSELTAVPRPRAVAASAAAKVGDGPAIRLDNLPTRAT
jgi:hypothetical protein